MSVQAEGLFAKRNHDKERNANPSKEQLHSHEGYCHGIFLSAADHGSQHNLGFPRWEIVQTKKGVSHKETPPFKRGLLHPKMACLSYERTCGDVQKEW